MESTYLKTFVEVVHSGNFSKAAEALFVTQSAVSRRVKYMEDQYGTMLLNRSGPVLQPTEAGWLVYEKARRMLALESELAKGLQTINDRKSLAFACTRPFGITFLPGIIKSFTGRYEGKIDIRLSFEMPHKALEGLRENRHDIIVVEHWEKIDFSPFSTLRLGIDEMLFVSAPQLGLSAPEVAVDDLLRQRLYRRKEDCCSGKLLAFNMMAIGRDPHEFGNILIYDDLHVIIESVCAGEGIAFVSSSLVAKELEQGKLRGHRVEGFCHSRRRTIAYRDELLQSQPLRYFINCVSNTFAAKDEILKPS